MSRFSPVVAGVLAACIASVSLPASAADISPDATMTIGIGISMNTLDPAQQNTTTVRNVLDYEVQTLVTFNEKGELQPLLATSWEWSDTGNALTLHLREGVKFHDGTPFDAEAAKFSLGRLIDDKVSTPNGQSYQVINNIEVLDDHTIRLDLDYPTADLLNALGDTVSAMMSPASVDAEGNSYENLQNPVGTGPYKLVRHMRGSQLVFERDEDYWGDKPYYKNVVLKIVPESNALEAGLRAGQLDLIMNPPVSDLVALEADPNIAIIKAPSDRSVYLSFVTNKPPFDSKEVRQALNYAVDKEAIIKNVMFDAVNLSDSPFAPSVSGYCETGVYEYNPEKAKQMLKDAGAEGIQVNMGTPRGRYTQDYEATQAIASYLRQVGVQVEIGTADWATYTADIFSVDRNPYNLFLLGWAPPAMDAMFQMTYFSKIGWPPNGVNGTFYDNPEMEAIFEKAQREVDDEKRNDMYCQIQKMIFDDAPWMFLWSQNLILAHNKNIEGISYQPNEKFVTIYARPKG